MILRNTSVGALQDSENGWPDKLELDGFVYKQLGSIVEGHSDSMANRPTGSLIRWLEKQQPYSPHPYNQLAHVIRDLGKGDAADAVLYAGKERERSSALMGESLWLFLKNWAIGYGYKIGRAIYWAILFVIAGAVIFRTSKEAKENRMPYGIAYSFDMLLPIIKLREAHYKIDLSGWRRYYFFFHKISGYVLASFLIAGLSGLVK